MARPRKPVPRPVQAPRRVIGYLRVSTDEQGESGAGMDAQRAVIAAAAAVHGWGVDYATEVASGGRDDRPVLEAALARLDAGDADALVVAKLDRLTRSVRHLLAVADRSRDRSWSLVLLDSGADLATAAGRGVVSMLASVAEMERGLISERTRDALAARRAAGVKLGRPSGLAPVTVTRILTQRGDGLTLQAIADGLNDDAVTTSRGGSVWRPSQVQAVLVANGTR